MSNTASSPLPSAAFSPASPQSSKIYLNAIWPYIWDYRGRVLLALMALLVAKIANVGVPILLKYLVDNLNQPAELLTLPLLLLLIYGGLRLSSSFFNELRDALFARVRYRAMRRLSNELLTHLHQLSLRFHLERRTGAISRDLERGTRSISSILNYLVFNIIPTIAELSLITGILLWNYHFSFTVITLVTIAIYVIFTFVMMDWRIKYRHQMNASESEANTQAIDSLVNYETVKYFGNEAFEAQRYDKTLREWEDSAVKSQTTMSALNFGQAAIIAVGVTLIMIAASREVVAGQMSLGDLVLVNAFLLQLFVPLNFLGVVYRSMKYAFIDMGNLFKLLEEKPEIQDKPNAKSLVIGNGDVEFKNVSFFYQKERPILHHISFTIPAGHKVAVVGASGAGKSTLGRLLLRFYDVQHGGVYINGQNISDITQASLRAAIGIVPQDTVLFNESIFYNIHYALPSATEEAVIEAAKLANLHEFILQLPQGYETLVGERGLKLSGGEKQRVAIARAILKRPKILIFDEATSALDSHSEQAIQQALSQVAEDHTTLVIAHRLSTIVDAEQILVMSNGAIIERGNHSQLLALNGTYAQMWALQQQETNHDE
jgi:ATP-binding cassette, subfamily B, heavy metal transporter